MCDKAKTVGPDMDGGFYRPVKAEYDREKDMTTVLFVPVAPNDWTPEMALVRSKQMSNRDRFNILAALINPSRRHYSEGTLK